jgi:hypothetical protein
LLYLLKNCGEVSCYGTILLNGASPLVFHSNTKAGYQKIKRPPIF